MAGNEPAFLVGVLPTPTGTPPRDTMDHEAIVQNAWTDVKGKAAQRSHKRSDSCEAPAGASTRAPWRLYALSMVC